MLCVLSVDDGYIEINDNLIAIVPNKEDATEIEVNDFISTVKSIKEDTGMSDEIDMGFNDNIGKVKMSMDDFFRQCTACGVRAFSFLCEWVTAHGVYENRE